MALNKINYRYFTNKKMVEVEPRVIYANKFNETISLTKNNQSLSFDYVGFKLIKCVNTNKAIKDLLYKNHIELDWFTILGHSRKIKGVSFVICLNS